jgi:hypothetical protein
MCQHYVSKQGRYVSVVSVDDSAYALGNLLFTGLTQVESPASAGKRLNRRSRAGVDACDLRREPMS